ncbi:hypothetical protein [Methylophaga sp. OBS3]|uniref:hypothetical protein n=1 Tax=Methylophaga sp. OBS3 TaxID=2991934 RepID=UPI00225B76E2|nr:hypothetical protein [Methylophaga sp. OBS3]MCX4188800.1 hypothetical protein [Methylophaga sp. OBS3]
MSSAFFRQQWAALQAQLRQSQTESWLKRIFVWLMLGVMMVFSLFALLFLLLLSWILLPLMIFRARRAMRRQQQSNQGYTARNDDNVIEGEIIDRER